MKRILLFSIFVISISCSQKENKPNIILIMADDMGYECLSINGATEYETPNLDKMGRTGMRFTNVYSQPLCTPSRVKIMTGKYNYRNYEYFGYLNPNQKTFGNLMKDAGYKTCIAGKWQLNGLSFELPGKDDTSRPNHFGFDEHCLWQLHRPRKDGERYADPLIFRNGRKVEGNEESYGPDIFANFICDFIDKNKDESFFIYYPMVLVHDPFVPTPDSPEWKSEETRNQKNTKYFKDMMAYTDKVIGQIQQKLKEHSIDKNTLIIFTADNGTHKSIITQTVDGPYVGGKSFTTQRGIHVPFVASWPQRIKNPGDYDGVIDFSDFYPTIAEIVDVDVTNENLDGISFLKVFDGNIAEKKSTTLIHYDPEWGNASKNRNRFSMTNQYKLYQDGRFIRFTDDIDELDSLTDLTKDEVSIRGDLQSLLKLAESESPWEIKSFD